MALEIHIDRDLCMGSGQCLIAAPTTFDLDALSVAIVVDPNGDSESAVINAEEGCPTGAIQVLDVATGRPLRSV